MFLIPLLKYFISLKCECPIFLTLAPYLSESNVQRKWVCLPSKQRTQKKECTGNMISHTGKGIAEAPLGLAQTVFVFWGVEQIILINIHNFLWWKVLVSENRQAFSLTLYSCTIWSHHFVLYTWTSNNLAMVRSQPGITLISSALAKEPQN